MIRYKDVSGKSGVKAYSIGPNYIKIRFQGDDMYLYSYHNPGKAAVEQMKKLAIKGQGLSTYISQHVKEKYEAKL